MHKTQSGSPTHMLWKLGNLTTQNLVCRQHLNLVIFDEHCHRSFLDAIASLASTRPVVCSRKISAVTPRKFSYHGHHQHHCVKNFAQELHCGFLHGEGTLRLQHQRWFAGHCLQCGLPRGIEGGDYDDFMLKLGWQELGPYWIPE